MSAVGSTPKGTWSLVAGWGLIVGGTILTVSVFVDFALGDGFAWWTLAWMFVLCPEGVRYLDAERGSGRIAARIQALLPWRLGAAALLLWAGLITDWARGHGTDWLVLVAAVLVLASVAVTAFASVTARAERRRARTEGADALG
ncbi:hypothetical protein ACFU99_08810 [Streptomyces sp. NPDC057654]|uniref:hypothetical protein n=1 Tax=Streptomyces sp. NPDC057654 TaxID=3346196 RepID=UPI003684B774